MVLLLLHIVIDTPLCRWLLEKVALSGGLLHHIALCCGLWQHIVWVIVIAYVYSYVGVGESLLLLLRWPRLIPLLFATTPPLLGGLVLLIGLLLILLTLLLILLSTSSLLVMLLSSLWLHVFCFVRIFRPAISLRGWKVSFELIKLWILFYKPNKDLLPKTLRLLQ